jgi:hypothetical protein
MTIEELQSEVQAKFDILAKRIEEIPAYFAHRFTDALVSPNYSAGQSGWKIGEDGDVEFGSGFFRGDITGASGTFSGSLTANSINIPSTATGWHVDTSGNMWWGAYATFAAAQAASATRIGANGGATFTSLTISGYIATGGAAADVNAGVVTINGGQITANSIVASKMSVSTLSSITANIGTITAGAINGITITGGTIQTATSGERVTLNGSTLRLEFRDSAGTLRGSLRAATATRATGLVADSDITVANNKSYWITSSTGGASEYGGMSITNLNQMWFTMGTANQLFVKLNSQSGVDPFTVSDTQVFSGRNHLFSNITSEASYTTAGAMHWNSSLNKMRICDNSGTWRSVTMT